MLRIGRHLKRVTESENDMVAWLEYVMKNEEARREEKMNEEEKANGGEEQKVERRDEQEIVGDIIHAMKCLIMYIRLEVRVLQRQEDEKAKQLERRRRAKWLVCAAIVRAYKEQKQNTMLQERAQQREGRVCSRTRNVGRVTPMGGVVYDETTRRGKRLPAHLVCKQRSNRWPLRDKCGPTLVRTLFHVWNVDGM